MVMMTCNFVQAYSIDDFQTFSSTQSHKTWWMLDMDFRHLPIALHSGIISLRQLFSKSVKTNQPACDLNLGLMDGM